MIKAKKLLKKFDFAWQATALRHELERNNIESVTTFRPREYSQIFVGGVQDSADLWVNETNFVKAQDILKKFEGQPVIVEDVLEKNYFRQVIILSLIGICFVPLIFNLLATRNYFLLVKKTPIHPGRLAALFILLVTWVVALIETFFIFR